MIDRYHLRYFLAVIDTGNFSRAAAACHVSQPTLSIGIGKLEKQLGAPLFHRTSRRVELTAAGGRLAVHARAIEAGFAQAERTVAGGGVTATLRLGVLASTPRRWIEDMLARHRAGGVGTRIELVEGRERDLHERLARGRIDVALCVLRSGDQRYRRLSLLTEGYALTLSATHPLARRTSVVAEELIGEPMVLRRHCEQLAETSRFFTTHGIRPFFAARTTSDDRALSYVRAGLGVTIMPQGFPDRGVVRVAVQGFDLTREIGLLYAPHLDPDALGAEPLASMAEALRLAANDGAGGGGNDAR